MGEYIVFCHSQLICGVVLKSRRGRFAKSLGGLIPAQRVRIPSTPPQQKRGL
mgnify:CR=1 FL=1